MNIFVFIGSVSLENYQTLFTTECSLKIWWVILCDLKLFSHCTHSTIIFSSKYVFKNMALILI